MAAACFALLTGTIWPLLMALWFAVVSALTDIGIMSIALAFRSTSYLRYVFPAWVILTAAIGVALDNALSRNTISKYFWSISVVTVIGLNLLFFS